MQEKPKIVIAGATGTIGEALVTCFENLNYHVYIIGRADFKRPIEIIYGIVTGADVVINLCGETILQRWTKRAKKRMLSSRVDTTQKIIDAIMFIEDKAKRPKLYISASAIGIYENNGTHTESEHKVGTGFVSELVSEWEKESERLSELQVRRVVFRLGVVLSNRGGYFTKIKPIFKFGLGGKVGSGNQTLSFIHIKDLCNAFLHVINNKSSCGIYNLTSSTAICNENFTKALGQKMNRPTFCTVPSLVIQILFGQASSVILKGATVVPERLMQEGFNFEYSNYIDAIEELVS